MIYDEQRNIKYQYGMISTPLTITPLRRSWLARRWPLYLWGVHDEHAVDHYTSEAFMTSTPLTITPLRRSWLACHWPLQLWGSHDEHVADRYTSIAVMTITLLTITLLRQSWRELSCPLHIAGFVKNCLKKTTVRSFYSDTLYWLQPNKHFELMIKEETSNTNKAWLAPR